MRREHIEDLIAKEVETIIAGSDIELVDVEYVRERDWYLRVLSIKKAASTWKTARLSVKN